MTERAEQESAAKSSWTDQIEPAANITGQSLEGRMLASIAMSLKRLADQVDGVVARATESAQVTARNRLVKAWRTFKHHAPYAAEKKDATTATEKESA